MYLGFYLKVYARVKKQRNPSAYYTFFTCESNIIRQFIPVMHTWCINDFI